MRSPRPCRLSNYVGEWSTEHKRIPISGWDKCLHEAASFDSRGEFEAAVILDGSAQVEWWLRNDPPLFRISTPVGGFEPDFVYLAKRNGQHFQGILEIKGGLFWDAPRDPARLKSEAAGRWVKAANVADAGQVKWEFATVLDTDAIAAGSLEQLRKNALFSYP